MVSAGDGSPVDLGEGGGEKFSTKPKVTDAIEF